MFAGFLGTQRAPFHIKNLHFIWIIAGRFFRFDAFWMRGRRKKEKSIPISSFFLHLLWKFSASEGLGALSTCCRVFLGRHDPGRSLEGTRGGEGCESRRPRWCERRPPERYHARSHLLMEWRFHFRKVKKKKKSSDDEVRLESVWNAKLGIHKSNTNCFKYLQAFSGGSRGKFFSLFPTPRWQRTGDRMTLKVCL